MWEINADSNLVSGLYALLIDTLLVWVYKLFAEKLTNWAATVDIYDRRQRFSFKQLDLPLTTIPISLGGKWTKVTSIWVAAVPLLFLIAGFSINGETRTRTKSISEREGVVFDVGRVNDEFIQGVKAKDGQLWLTKFVFHSTRFAECYEGDIAGINIFTILLPPGGPEWDSLEGHRKRTSELTCLNREISGELNLQHRFQRPIPVGPDVCPENLGELVGVEELYEHDFGEGIKDWVRKLTIKQECDGKELQLSCMGSACIYLGTNQTSYVAETFLGVNWTSVPIPYRERALFTVQDEYKKVIDEDLEKVRARAAIILASTAYRFVDQSLQMLFFRSEVRDWYVYDKEQNVSVINPLLMIIPVGLAAFIIITSLGVLLRVISSPKGRMRLQYATPVTREGLVSMFIEESINDETCKVVKGRTIVEKLSVGVQGARPHYGLLGDGERVGSYPEESIAGTKLKENCKAD